MTTTTADPVGFIKFNSQSFHLQRDVKLNQSKVFPKRHSDFFGSKVDFFWDGEPIELLLDQKTALVQTKEIVWGSGSLGVVIKEEKTSHLLIATRVSRPDSVVETGDILDSLDGVKVTKSNWAELFAQAKRKSTEGVEQIVQFRNRPELPTVKLVRGSLARAGVKVGHQLLSANNDCLRYLHPRQVMDRLADLPKPCVLQFGYLPNDAVTLKEDICNTSPNYVDNFFSQVK